MEIHSILQRQPWVSAVINATVRSRELDQQHHDLNDFRKEYVFSLDLRRPHFTHNISPSAGLLMRNCYPHTRRKHVLTNCLWICIVKSFWVWMQLSSDQLCAWYTTLMNFKVSICKIGKILVKAWVHSNSFVECSIYKAKKIVLSFTYYHVHLCHVFILLVFTT